MDPGKPEIKHNGNNRFQEGNKPESSRPLLDLDCVKNGPSDVTKSTSPPSVGVQSLPEFSGGSFGSEIFPGPLEAKRPPVKAKKQADNYDPNRIPASIFSTEPNNPGEWSIASNESLFSIQNSFSRNSSLLRGMPDHEQPNLSEAKSNESGCLSVGLPSLVDVPTHSKSSIISGHEKKDSNSVGNEANAKISPAWIDHPPAVKKSGSSSRGALLAETTTISTGNGRLSDESAASSSSFAFPVLVKDAGKNSSVNWASEDPEKPQLQQEQVPEETTPNASKKKRFCCFPFWCRCCCC